MNGAVMDHQDSDFLYQQKKASGQHCPEYHQMHQSCQQNCLHQHSKAMNYQLLSDSSLIDGIPQHLLSRNTHKANCKQIPSAGSLDPRSNILYNLRREPLELPVPKFEIDNDYVAESNICPQNQKQNAKDLDLDTRINLLIKSKALSCMHPIFSELDESTSDSDELFMREIKSTDKFRYPKNDRVLSPTKDDITTKSSNDSEEPLSRPPSPFLSRATYLFWFNKAIELKLHAKAQEKALLEEAAKRLLQEHLLPPKINKTDSLYQEENNMVKLLLSEVSKEFKEVVKQEFINEVLENTVISTFEHWWEEEKHQEINTLHSCVKSNNGFESIEVLNNVETKECANQSFLVHRENTSSSICLNLNESGTNINKTDRIKVGQNKKEPFDFSAGTNITNSNYSGNPNNKESLISLHMQSDKEFKGNKNVNMLHMNVGHCMADNTKTGIEHQCITSSQLSKSNIPDIVKTQKPGKCEMDTVKNVLNLIVNDVDRITY